MFVQFRVRSACSEWDKRFSPRDVLSVVDLYTHNTHTLTLNIHITSVRLKSIPCQRDNRSRHACHVNMFLVTCWHNLASPSTTHQRSFWAFIGEGLVIIKVTGYTQSPRSRLAVALLRSGSSSLDRGTHLQPAANKTAETTQAGGVNEQCTRHFIERRQTLSCKNKCMYHKVRTRDTPQAAAH